MNSLQGFKHHAGIKCGFYVCYLRRNEYVFFTDDERILRNKIIYTEVFMTVKKKNFFEQH